MYDHPFGYLTENAATIIQSYFRKCVERQSYLKERNAVVLLQTVIRALLAKKKSELKKSETQKQLEVLSRCTIFIGDRRKFVKLKRSVTLIQHSVRAWICRRHHGKSTLVQDMGAGAVHAEQASFACEANKANATQIKAISTLQNAQRKFVVHKTLHQQHIAATKIQCCYRGWVVRKNFLMQKQATIKVQSAFRYLICLRNFQQYKEATRLAVVIQCHVRGWIARRGMHRLRLIIRIQSYRRGYLRRREFLVQKAAVVKIQRAFLSRQCQKIFHCYREGATEIQRFIRGQIARRRLLGASLHHRVVPTGDILISGVGLHSPNLIIFVRSVVMLQRWWRDILTKKSGTKAAIIIQSHIRGWIARRQSMRERLCIAVIQRWWRGILIQETRMRSVIVIQSYTRQWLARQEANREKQDLVQNTRKRSAIIIQSYTRQLLVRRNVTREKHCVTVIQTWWRNVLMQKTRIRSAIVIQSYTRRWLAMREATRERHSLVQATRMRSAVIIQSYTRRWLVRREAMRERHRITVIQSYWKGYLARKDSRGQLLDLRLRVQKSAANVDDSMRIINRLLAALSDLLDMKSVSGILHTCKTLDMATKHSQKCCEKLVEAGAIDTLLRLIRSVSRSIPDQEVLKHALSTLRNLARYPHLVDELIANHVSVTTIFLEFLRNKEEGYFVASELLEKICSNPKGVEAVSNSPALLKRLNILVEDLKRQAGNEKRNIRGVRAREQVERRLREAVELLKLIMNG